VSPPERVGLNTSLETSGGVFLCNNIVLWEFGYILRHGKHRIQNLEMKEYTSVSTDEFNDTVAEFLQWLTRQQRMKQVMDKDKISSLVFQVKWGLVETTLGESVLWAEGRGTCMDMESDILFTNRVKKKLSMTADAYAETLAKETKAKRKTQTKKKN